MTNTGAPSLYGYIGVACWALTDKMLTGGDLLVANKEEMMMSKDRVKTKLKSDGPGEYNGPSVEKFDRCSKRQKRIVCYYKLFRFLYGYGLHGVRITLPSCCVLRIQTEYPGDNIEPADIEEHHIIG